jgi:hypothetical protein
MSRKTKKEKIIADYRKRLKLFSQNQNSPVVIENKQIQPNQKKIARPDKLNRPPSSDIEKNRFFIKDFRKSIFIISLIITLEIVLYFARINR